MSKAKLYDKSDAETETESDEEEDSSDDDCDDSQPVRVILKNSVPGYIYLQIYRCSDVGDFFCFSFFGIARSRD